MSSESFYNIELELSFIAGILQYPDLYNEISHITYKDFSNQNASIYSVIKNVVENKGEPTPIVLANHMKAIGINLDGVEPIDLLVGLMRRGVTKKGMFEIAKELKTIALVRTICENADRLKREVIDNRNKSGTEIIGLIDKYLGNTITSLESDEGGAVNLDDGMADYLDELGNTPIDSVGFNTPFELWNGYFSGLEKGAVSMVGARTGSGKSTFLIAMADGIVNKCNPDRNIKVLYIDTEMDINKQRERVAAARIGCPYHLIRTGNYRRDPVWAPKMREAILLMRDNKKENFWFKEGHDLTGTDLKNFIKRWFYRYVGRGGDALVVLDYLKPLASDMMKSNRAEWEIIYQKMQMLKDVALELGIHIMTAIQLNTSASTKDKSMGQVDDTENALTMSKRLDWLLNWSGILRKMIPDEMALYGPEFGTHVLIPHKSREQGILGSGHHNLVKVFREKKIRYVDNFLTYRIENFRVEETGDLKMIAEQKGWNKVPLQKKDESLPI